jgi:FixJ family two-component response regulator/anti-sigma regulatory factor (Ser/Thr protein kinase)
MTELEMVEKLPGRVLVVDDDNLSRRCLKAFLEKAGHTVLPASGVDDAVQLLKTTPLGTVDCVVTDYRMPDKDGLWMLRWLQEHAPEMAAIMVTAEGEKELVTATLRQGACDFLDKPVDSRLLVAAVVKAIEHTRRRRDLSRAESDVKAVGRIQLQMVGGGIPECGLSVELCYHPSHEAGGDYLSVFPLGQDRFLVLATDVSGHDLRAAYLSAYFQGFVRGMMETRTPIEEVLGRFNRFLLDEANKGSAEVTSVAACALLLERGQGVATSLSCGFPMAVYCDGARRVTTLGELWSSPLGWFDNTVDQPVKVDVSSNGRFYLWTDGLEDLAAGLGASPFALAFALLQARRNATTPIWLRRAADDILLAAVDVGPVAPGASPFLPIFSARYSGVDQFRVDTLQEEWARSLALALPGVSQEKLFDVLLCTREIAVNAMKYGCAGREDLHCSMLVLCNPESELIRVVISDPGPGHGFDWRQHKQQTETTLIDEHRGLILVGMMTTRVETQRRGAYIEMDFTFQETPAALAG